jgi:hypothetical protein
MNVEDDLTLDETRINSLYMWIDSIPLSRPKKSFSRDFADGFLLSTF